MLDSTLHVIIQNNDTVALQSHFETLSRDPGISTVCVENELQLGLVWAASAGHSDMVEELIHLGALANKPESSRGHLPLVVAAQHGHLEVMKRLVHYGADPTAPDKWGRTPRITACMYRHSDIVLWLDSLKTGEVG